MGIFEKRPLSIILCILLGGFSLFVLLQNVLRWILVISAILFLLVFLILHKRFGIFPIVSAIVLLLSFALSFIYFECYFPIYNRVKGPAVIKGEITEIIYNEPFGALISVKTKKIGKLPFSKSNLLVSFVPEDSEDFSIKIGDTFLMYGEISELESEDFGFDEKSYYEAKGIQGIVKDVKALAFTKNSHFSIRLLLSTIRESVKNYITRSTDGETAGLLSALILGEKSELSGQLRLDFKRIGLSHLLAISGMHLAILSAGLHKLLSLLSLDKKWRSIISMLFVIAYMGLTGFQISVLRAGTMLLIANILFLLAKTQDSFTNLMIAISAICLISPYAIRDISLLLSFFATIGVLIAAQILDDVPYYISIWLKVLLAIASAVLSTFFAIAMTLPFSVFNFGRISLLSPITTLIFSVLIEIFMYLGSLFLLIGAPRFLLVPLSGFSDFIVNLSEWFAKMPDVYIVANSLIVKILCVVFYVLFLLFLVLQIEHRKIALLFLLIPFLSIFTFGYVSTQEPIENNRIVYFSDTEKNDVILAIQDKTIVLANFTDNTHLSRSYLLYLLEQENILALDFLWIPQYTANLPEALSTILSNIPIRHVYLPEPTNDAEVSAYASSRNVLRDFRCTFSQYTSQETIAIKDMRLHPVYRAQMEDGCRSILSIQMDGQYYTYISNGTIEEKNADLTNYVMAISRAIVFGCRGRSYRETYYLEESSPYTNTLIFASDKIEIAQDVYEDYRNRARMLYKPKQVELTKQ